MNNRQESSHYPPQPPPQGMAIHSLDIRSSVSQTHGENVGRMRPTSSTVIKVQAQGVLDFQAHFIQFQEITLIFNFFHLNFNNRMIE